MIATGCEDKCVRVFYVAASTDLPLKVFSGKQQFLIDTNQQLNTESMLIYAYRIELKSQMRMIMSVCDYVFFLKVIFW